MVAYDLKNIGILNVKGVDYRCVLWNMSKNNAINRLNNSKLDDRGTLWIWIFLQIKHPLKYEKKVQLEVLILDTFILVLVVQKVTKRIWWVEKHWSDVL